MKINKKKLVGDVVLVTIQFRLGAFGFLALDTQEVPGNAGLKDQVLALKWIKRNIKRFGGDPEKITLAGLSSGAHSATAHMISPMSEGLFHNIIAASGALPWQRKLKTNNIDLGRQLAGRLSCNTENIDSMTECLTFVSDKKAEILLINLEIFVHFSDQLTKLLDTWSFRSFTAP